MLALKEFRDKAAALPDLMNYAALIDEGVVLGKDGSLLAGFYFRGDDAVVATASERNYLTAQVNQYLAQFGSGWALWVDAIRVDSPGYPSPDRSHFPEPITALIDAERRAMFSQQGNSYESRYALVLQYLPPLRHDSKFNELVYAGGTPDTRAAGDRHLDEFKKKLDDFESGLGDQIHLERMGTKWITGPDGESFASDELVNHLHQTLTGEKLALRIPDCPMYLDSWLGYPELYAGVTPLLGDKYIAVVAIEGFPGSTVPGILDMLDSLPISYRWSSRFIAMDQHESVYSLNRYRMKWQQKVRGFVSQIMQTAPKPGSINRDAEAMAVDAETAMNEARSGLVAYGYYTPVVVLMHENEAHLGELARYVKKVVDRHGFAGRIESVNTMEAWLGSLPGHPYPNVRRPLLHTLSLSDLLPLASAWPGLENNPCEFYEPDSPALMQCVTTGSTPFRLNFHVEDVGHTLVLGPTGGGKSTLLAIAQAQARRYRSKGTDKDGNHQPMSIVAFDKKHSLYTVCKATGGTHYDLGADDSPIQLAPLTDIDTDSDLAWAVDWVATCYALQAGHEVSPSQKNAIHRALMLLRDAPRNTRSLTALCSNIQDPVIREALQHYTLAGTMGHLYDGESDLVSIDPYTVFEIDELMKLSEANSLPALLYMFRLIERSMKGQPGILSLDEAWVLLGHPVFRDKIREWLKELRKNNWLVIMATQSLSDAISSGILDVLLEQCPTKIFLPNKHAEEAQSKALYQQFGLNDREIALIKSSTPKREYYYRSPLGRRKFELGLGPLARAFVAVSDKESLATVRELEELHGEDWPLHWLQHKGVAYEHYLEH